MEIRSIFYNTFSNKEFFELTEGRRKWDIFIIISKGSFSMSFDSLKTETVISENEIAYFPADTYFQRKLLSPIGLHQFAFFADTSHPFYRSLSAGKLSIPKEEVASIIKSCELLSMRDDNKEAILHTIEHICYEQYLYGEKHGKRSREYSDDIMSVLTFMNDNLSEKIDIDELAAKVYLSHTGLIKKFKKQVGTTPSDYLIMIRMRSAKQLLLEGEMQINEIAAKCGYTNAYYFTNAFHKRFGMSPSEFRKKNV